MTVQHVYSSGRLHDDTEEDLVGADWHQDAIRNVSDCLKNLAESEDLPWHVGDQLPLSASKPNGVSWRPSPDIMLHPNAGRAKRHEMVVATDGVPLLVIEVASPTTWRYDVDLREGKAWGYTQLGIPYYLVFDPTGELLGAPCVGWRQDGGVLREWPADADGRYYVRELGISLQPEGDLLRVFDSAGHPVPFSFEKTTLIEAQTEHIRTQAERIAELEAQLARLRQQESPQDGSDPSR